MGDSKLDVVRKLLAKAEHPSTPAAEAEALSAKAEELMARYAIDQALLMADSPGKGRPESQVVHVPAPYLGPKVRLLGAVASAYDVRSAYVVQSGGGDRVGRVTLVGYRSDLQVVEVLFTSLLLQATAAMLREDDGGRPRSFRQSFLLGFAARVGQRLRRTRLVARQEATAERGTGAELVLVDRRQAVDSAYREMFPRLRAVRMSSSNYDGSWAGQRAGDTASLSTGRNAMGGGRRALG